MVVLNERNIIFTNGSHIRAFSNLLSTPQPCDNYVLTLNECSLYEKACFVLNYMHRMSDCSNVGLEYIFIRLRWYKINAVTSKHLVKKPSAHSGRVESPFVHYCSSFCLPFTCYQWCGIGRRRSQSAWPVPWKSDHCWSIRDGGFFENGQLWVLISSFYMETRLKLRAQNVIVMWIIVWCGCFRRHEHDWACHKPCYR